MILGKKFVIDDLDETHLFVSAEIVSILQEKVWEIMDNNSFNITQNNWWTVAIWFAFAFDIWEISQSYEWICSQVVQMRFGLHHWIWSRNSEFPQ